MLNDRHRRVLTSGALVLMLGCAAQERSSAQAQAACPGTLSHLLSYAGTYRTTDLLADPDVARALGRLLADEQDHLERNLAVSGSIDLVACHLVISGNAEHQGGVETGIIAVSLIDGTVSAAIQSGERIRIHAGVGDYLGVPVAIRDWVVVAATGFQSRFGLPPEAALLPPREP